MCWDIFQRHGLDNRYMGIYNFLFDVVELNIIDWQRKIANR